MRYSQIRTLDISNGEGVGMSLFTQGCPFHCKNCFNSETWDYDGGLEYTEETEQKILNLIKRPFIKRLSVLGGEPFLPQNKEQLLSLIKTVKEIKPELKIWFYSGNTIEKLLDEYKEILYLVDILVDGPFIDNLKDLSLKFRGSSNQRLIDVQKTLKKGVVVLYEE